MSRQTYPTTIEPGPYLRKPVDENLTLADLASFFEHPDVRQVAVHLSGRSSLDLDVAGRVDPVLVDAAPVQLVRGEWLSSLFHATVAVTPTPTAANPSPLADAVDGLKTLAENLYRREFFDIVFDGPVGAMRGPRYVEVEDPDGQGIRIGEWLKRPDGYNVLRVPGPSAALAELAIVQRELAIARDSSRRLQQSLTEAHTLIRSLESKLDGGAA